MSGLRGRIRSKLSHSERVQYRSNGWWQQYLDFNLNLLWSVDPIAWVAVSVDLSSDGSAWVAEREHSEVGGSTEHHAGHFERGVRGFGTTVVVRAEAADFGLFLVLENCARERGDPRCATE